MNGYDIVSEALRLPSMKKETSTNEDGVKYHIVSGVIDNENGVNGKIKIKWTYSDNMRFDVSKAKKLIFSAFDNLDSFKSLAQKKSNIKDLKVKEIFISIGLYKVDQYTVAVEFNAPSASKYQDGKAITVHYNGQKVIGVK